MEVCGSDPGSKKAVYGEVVSKLFGAASLEEEIQATDRELVHWSGEGGDGV